ncbi:MAG: glycosyltransferase family 2 protein [Rhizobiaceae bacterium]|nr:MAG: glycosyltransferase family 2 protein [Rhizobiaceae bacterium]CAG0972115.1 hypothetical protein RHIZO_01274 [Rhizobiaceae bacterium]
MGIDLTVVVTAHDEGIIAGPTMRSVEAAIGRAKHEGRTVERLIGLDNPTDECFSFFSESFTDEWAIHRHSFKDPFLLRNAMASIASGRWIAFVDADDLVSENWFFRAMSVLAAAEDNGNKVIVHPELNWIFDESHGVFSKPDQEDILFNPYYFYTANYYDMMSVYPLAAILDIPYDSRDIANGFGYQDWQWNIQTMARGWKHTIARDTVIFKRRRQGSVSVVNNQNKAIIRSLDEMAIDRVSLISSSVSVDDNYAMNHVNKDDLS